MFLKTFVWESRFHVKQQDLYDVIVVGGGHAGIEAAMIARKLKQKTVLITQDKKALGRMSCNPSIGGLAKGQMVREMDVLGGLMGSIADAAGLQFKVLNKKKGRSVWSPRAQVDKRLYEKLILQKTVKAQVKTITGEVVSIKTSHSSVTGVVLRDGSVVRGKSVILTCGTFVNGLIHIGERKIRAGRMGEAPASGITESLSSLGFKIGRLKTGTPPRLIKSSIRWKQGKEEVGDKNPVPFSYFTKNFNPINTPCHSFKTNKKTKALITDQIKKSPMFSGDIGGVGPRYCPSIEDKVYRFKEQDEHTLFLEPEWLNSDQIYVNGFSTSLPEETQVAALRTVPGLESVSFFRPGYAIEYDFFHPAQLRSTLETKEISGLFFAGQINGTSGYEEAGAQGLIAGINASKKASGGEALVLSRSSSYIGVMIDDLITKNTFEPYRMFTSRAEYRLLLRYSNTEERLLPFAKKHNLLNKKEITLLDRTIASKGEIFGCLDKSIEPENLIKKSIVIKQRTPAKTILKQPACQILDLPAELFSSAIKSFSFEPWLFDELFFETESKVKYAGYIKRLKAEIEKLSRNNTKIIPRDFDYENIPGLSSEAKEKLSYIKPETLGQVSRISGITPSDVSVVLVNIK